MEQLREQHSVCKIFSPETSKAVYRIFDAGIAKEFNLKPLFEGTYTQCEHFMQNGLPVPCGCKLCPNDATSQVSFFLSPNHKATPATTEPVLFVCDEHSNVQFVDICSEYTWNTIVDNFRKRNLAMPQKQFSGLVIEPIKAKQYLLIKPNPGVCLCIDQVSKEQNGILYCANCNKIIK